MGSHKSARRAIPAIKQAVEDDSPRRRAAAAEAMGWMVDQAGLVVPALQACLSDSDENVRRSAIFALGRLGSGASEAMVTVLESDDVQVCALAAEGLSKLPSIPAAATDRLVQLTGDDDPQVRELALVALVDSNLDSSELIPMIASAVTDPERQVQGRCDSLDATTW